MEIDYRWVQTRLRALGFEPGPIDGVRGPRTDAAVVAFKRSIGFRARPYIGPLTLAALRPVETLVKNQLPWMQEAAKVRGLHEQRNTSRLRGWFDQSVSWIDPRDIAWCGAFVATCHRLADPIITLPENPLGARNWKPWGQGTDPVLGATLVFWRVSRTSWQGHVGFYFGEDDSHFHVLGGNQSNAVTVTRIAKDRLLASRWPIGVPVTGRRIHLTPSGVPISNNEA
ncbi:peptidoglycan-binding protein [Phaeobacter gallaeciensis]|uniref:NlpC/P60 family protein n=1 Tax=Phaeobacter gallaeciensis TaxID=60890 RepID=UPI00237F9E50|nr:peptidoglycan-binding protein [Phaeobacter gallaeciensis]MDE4303633.1 peptidoglycan-binding protein [Phaeobacter gallaeciensis]MDE4307885.1 peptidoglycan-binding protein [Phaeobacter gallaeciensis]MDE4312343.1 peptidoglycan-binding protein [Phaeobacter gallaeciensis]MDE4316814.1 peptidoglycan-binding protein [Phaeobacter gallaeciensis]MDE4321277.1 peptidoglycan-binding protein [Phaeobacter gallaeciensis]